MSMKSLFFSQLSRELSWAAVPVESVSAEHNKGDKQLTVFNIYVSRKNLPDKGNAVSDLKVRLWVGEDMLTNENHNFNIKKYLSSEDQENIIIPIEVKGIDLSDKEIHSAEVWILWKK